MAETKNYTKLVPFQPPEGLMEWALANAPKLRENVMVYKLEWVPDPITGLKHREVAGWCSACGETTMYQYYGGATGQDPYGFIDYEAGRSEPQFRHTGKDMLCPQCGAAVKVKHCGTFKEHCYLGSAWPMTVGRVEDRLVLTGWNVERELWKHGGRAYQVHVRIRPYEAYVTDEKKLVRLKAYSRFMSAVTFAAEWTQVKKCTNEWGISDLIFPWDKRILEGSTVENSKLDRYLKAKGNSRPITYLATWVKHRNVENLVMQGAGELLNDMYDHAVYYSGYYGTKASVGRLTDVDWKEKRPSRMLGLNQEEFRQVIRLGLKTYGLRMLRQMRESGQPLRTDAEVEACNAFGPQGVADMAEEGLPVLKIVRYIGKQRERYPREKNKLAASYMEDYWKMAGKAGEDLNDPRVKWPQHLTAAHDAMLLRVKWKENQELQAGFEANYRRNAPLSFEADGILIRPCRDQSELIAEGKYLNHCVGTYAKAQAEGKKCIFFIRRAEAPDIPWFTLEYFPEERQVLQNRGKCNCSRTPEIISFERKWLVWISRGAPRLPDGRPDIGEDKDRQIAGRKERKAG